MIFGIRNVAFIGSGCFCVFLFCKNRTSFYSYCVESKISRYNDTSTVIRHQVHDCDSLTLTGSRIETGLNLLSSQVFMRHGARTPLDHIPVVEEVCNICLQTLILFL